MTVALRIFPAAQESPSETLSLLNFYYCPPTELPEGNAFSRVCHSVCPWGVFPCDHYLWCLGLHCIAPPPTATDMWQPTLDTCSDLFTWGPLHSGVTSGGGHWSKYSLQLGGTHPTGMLSCLLLSFYLLFNREEISLQFYQFVFTVKPVALLPTCILLWSKNFKY